MARDPNHRDDRLIEAFVIGTIAGSHASRNRVRHDRPMSNRQHPPIHNLSARQAMTIASVAHIIGLVAGAVFLGFYAYTMWHL